jgi:hypothetical protein
MRDIKFRLLDENKKLVGYEKWTTGFLDKETGFYKSYPCWLYSKDNEYWNPKPIHHRFKNQCIQLKDKTGKEIYEGDILINDKYKDKKPFIIEWAKGCDYCGFVAKSEDHEIGEPFLNRNFVNCEIIGNIYENPDILKEE